MKKIILLLSAFSLLLFSCSSEVKDEKENNLTELNSESEINYLEKGMQFAMQTQKELGKNLMKQIKINGTASAVKFCSVSALKIVDSMQNVLHAKISRVTDKPRNESALANSEELKYIESYKQTLLKGEKPKPFTKEIGGKTTFYSPVLTNGMCMQCHGNEKDAIKFEVLTVLDSLYPTDKAKGYLPNQIRGMWKVEFEK